MGLDEIDKEVTENLPKQMSAEDRLKLDIVRTGSTWTRTAAYWAGQVDDKVCQLCLEDEEDANHFWKCKSLKKARREADEELEEINPEIIPPSLRGEMMSF